MITISFTVDGPLFGYRASTSKRKDADGKATKKGGAFDPDYLAFKDRVLKLAMVAGWKGRAASTKKWPVYLGVEVYWVKDPRIDWSNCYKAIEDSLFVEDRFVIPYFTNDVKLDAGLEKAIVTVVC